MDLNQALQEGIQTLSLQQAAEMVSFNLRPKMVMVQLERTKRFELLPAFLPILELDLYPDRCTDFVRLYTKCLVEEDQESAEILDKHLSRYLCEEDIAFYYGKICKEYKLVDWAKENYLNSLGYLKGLVAVDNLDLFLQASQQWPDKKLKQFKEAYFYGLASTHSAIKMLDYFGYTENPLTIYVNNCVHEQNLKTLEILFVRFEDKSLLVDLLKAKIERYIRIHEEGCKASFLQVCLEKGWLTFSGVEWKELAEKNPALYQQLQADV